MLPNRKIKLGTIILLVLFYFSETYGFLDTSTTNANDQSRICNLNRQEIKSDRRLKENERRQIDRMRLFDDRHLVSRESLNRVRDFAKTDTREGLDANNNIVRRQGITFDRNNKREREYRESERRGSWRNGRDINGIREGFVDQRQAHTSRRLSLPEASSVLVRINKDFSRQISEGTKTPARNINTRQNNRIEDNRRRMSRNERRQDSFSRREQESSKNGVASINNQRSRFSRVVVDKRQRRTSSIENTFRKERAVNEEEMNKRYSIETNGRTFDIRRNRDTSAETRRTISDRISRENHNERRINLSDRISGDNVAERRVSPTGYQNKRLVSDRISRENNYERRINLPDRISRDNVEEHRVRSTTHQDARIPTNRISRDNSEDRRTSFTSYQNKRISIDRRNNFEDRRMRSTSYENGRISTERTKPANTVEQERNRQIRDSRRNRHTSAETERISSDRTSRNNLQERRISLTTFENRRTLLNRLSSDNFVERRTNLFYRSRQSTERAKLENGIEHDKNTRNRHSRQSQTERTISNRISRDTFEERQITLPSHQRRQVSANRISGNNLKERRERLTSQQNRRDYNTHRSENEAGYSRRSIPSIENSLQRTDIRRFNSPERRHIRQPLFREKRDIEIRLTTNERNLRNSRKHIDISRDREQRNTLRLSESRKIDRNNANNDRRLAINPVDDTLAIRSSLERSRRYDFQSSPGRRTATNRRTIVVRQNSRKINERTMEDRSRSQRMVDRSQKPIYMERIGQRIALTNRIAREADDKRLSSEIPKIYSTTPDRRQRITNENQPKVIDNNNRRNRQSVAFHEKRTTERSVSGSRRHFDDKSTEKSFSLESRTVERRLPKRNEEYMRLDNKRSRIFVNNNERTTFNNKPNNNEETLSWLNIAKVLLLSISIAQIVSNSNSKKIRFNWLTNCLTVNKEKVH